MEILFGLLVIVLLVVGLRARKKSRHEWKKEERFEERGDWIDKRSGERGTYGSLDDEMESNRQYIAQKAKVSELSMAVQRSLYAEKEAYNILEKKALTQHLDGIKREIGHLFAQIQAAQSGLPLPVPNSLRLQDALTGRIKKQILDFCFETFPYLLDWEIADIQKLDQICDFTAHSILTAKR